MISAQDRRFAAVVGLGVTLAVGRVLLVDFMRGFQPIAWPQLPFFFRHDALLIVVLAWIACWSAVSSRLAQRVQGAVLWTVGGLLVAFTALNLLVIRELHVPLTYRLVVVSDHLRGLNGALAASILRLSALILGALALSCGLAAALGHMPRVLTTARRWFFSLPATLGLVVLFVGANMWAEQHLRYPGVGVNPLVAFIISLRDIKEPVLLGTNSDVGDFLPAAHPPASVSGPLVVSVAERRHPLNVVMVVMESVGAKWLRLHGASYPNSPEIERLARRGAVFNRMYSSGPNTSSAMGALFCSVYPLLALRTITRVYPDLQIPGLPAVLAAHGYRTALAHGGDLGYDDERRFLKLHGFAEVFDDPAGAPMGVASESATLVPGLKWLSAASQPFFLTLWTVQTHFPYYDDTSVSFATNNERMERYLNGVLAADRLVGEFVRAIDRLGLSDNTLFIITGDHGETFGLHGKWAHGFEIYDEEAWTPLVIAGPGVAAQTVTTPVRQIDIAPTMLGILGYTAPAEWQGVNLSVQSPPRRTYLFSGWNEFLVGMIENERKSIFHFPSGASEFYDLRSDPSEQHNLAMTDEGARELALSRQRIDAWVGFQNMYLAKFSGRADRPAQTGSSGRP